jgi:hypothetical protein
MGVRQRTHDSDEVGHSCTRHRSLCGTADTTRAERAFAVVATAADDDADPARTAGPDRSAASACTHRWLRRRCISVCALNASRRTIRDAMTVTAEASNTASPIDVASAMDRSCPSTAGMDRPILTASTAPDVRGRSTRLTGPPTRWRDGQDAGGSSRRSRKTYSRNPYGLPSAERHDCQHAYDQRDQAVGQSARRQAVLLRRTAILRVLLTAAEASASTPVPAP